MLLTSVYVFLFFVCQYFMLIAGHLITAHRLVSSEKLIEVYKKNPNLKYTGYVIAVLMMLLTVVVLGFAFRV